MVTGKFFEKERKKENKNQKPSASKEMRVRDDPDV